MANFPGTFIPLASTGSNRLDSLINEFMTPRLLAFRQICMYDEQARLQSDLETWSVTFGDWLEDFPLKVRKNEMPLVPASVTSIDLEHGTFQALPIDVGPDNRPRDEVEVDYQFDYFPVPILTGFYKNAVQNINTGAFGPPTSFSIDTAPSYWDGVMTDFAFALAMEKILQDTTLWKVRLIFAIGPNEIENGGGDFVSQIETLKTNAEERARATIENEKFKSGNLLAPPTTIYFDAIRGYGGSSRSGNPAVGGRLHGARFNNFF